MTGASFNRRGVLSGLISLSRSLGMIAGASVIGAVSAPGSKATDITTAPPSDIAADMRITFAATTILTVAALKLSTGAGRR